MDSGEKISRGFFVASCDASELFDHVEETLDEIAFGVEGPWQGFASNPHTDVRPGRLSEHLMRRREAPPLLAVH